MYDTINWTTKEGIVAQISIVEPLLFSVNGFPILWTTLPYFAPLELTKHTNDPDSPKP